MSSSTSSKLIHILQQKCPLEKNTKEKPTTIIALDGITINNSYDKVYEEVSKSFEKKHEKLLLLLQY